jgi:hypothetical protein
MEVSGARAGVPGGIGARAQGDFNAEYTEFAERMEGRVGTDRGARRTARGETDEMRKHKES